MNDQKHRIGEPSATKKVIFKTFIHNITETVKIQTDPSSQAYLTYLDDFSARIACFF
jgi:hypothetical protein